MDIELAIEMLELAPHLDQMFLFSGDGDFRSLVEAMQRKRRPGARWSRPISTSPPMVADELRRQSDEFLDLAAAHAEDRPRPGRAAARRAAPGAR